MEHAAEPTFWQAFGHLFVDLGVIVSYLASYAAHWVLLIVWVVWWLWGVNWNRAWQALASGAWAPAVLLLLIVALVWSRLAPAPCDCLGVVTIPNFWWQLGYVAMLAALALFCGWLQGVLHWTPPELDLEPPVHGFEHVHDHSLEVPPDKMAPEPHH